MEIWFSKKTNDSVDISLIGEMSLGENNWRQFHSSGYDSWGLKQKSIGQESRPTLKIPSRGWAVSNRCVCGLRRKTFSAISRCVALINGPAVSWIIGWLTAIFYKKRVNTPLVYLHLHMHLKTSLSYEIGRCLQPFSAFFSHFTIGGNFFVPGFSFQIENTCR